MKKLINNRNIINFSLNYFFWIVVNTAWFIVADNTNFTICLIKSIAISTFILLLLHLKKYTPLFFIQGFKNYTKKDILKAVCSNTVGLLAMGAISALFFDWEGIYLIVPLTLLFEQKNFSEIQKCKELVGD